ncbi:MAG TPA: hypothetical protein VIK67_00210, partial [Acholeplasma sp.]
MKITSEVVKVEDHQSFFNAIHKGVPFASIDMSSMTKEAWEIVKDLLPTLKPSKETSQLAKAFCIIKGILINNDMKDAFTVLLNLSFDGDQRAQYELAHMYKQGIGTSKNLERYEYWLKKSASRGHELAIQELKSIQPIEETQIERIVIEKPLNTIFNEEHQNETPKEDNKEPLDVPREPLEDTKVDELESSKIQEQPIVPQA